MGLGPARRFTADIAQPNPGSRADAVAPVPSACFACICLHLRKTLLASPRAARRREGPEHNAQAATTPRPSHCAPLTARASFTMPTPAASGDVKTPSTNSRLARRGQRREEYRRAQRRWQKPTHQFSQPRHRFRHGRGVTPQSKEYFRHMPLRSDPASIDALVRGSSDALTLLDDVSGEMLDAAD